MVSLYVPNDVWFLDNYKKLIEVVSVSCIPSAPPNVAAEEWPTPNGTDAQTTHGYSLTFAVLHIQIFKENEEFTW